MTLQRDLKIVIGVMIVLLITGIICYASLNSSPPDEPVRLMFQNKGGKVLFTHSVHAGEYASECLDCHHNLDSDEVYNCGECHGETGDGDLPSKFDAFHAQCVGCHEESGAGPVDCNSCHLL
jgi:hypothetical protein